MGDNDKIPVDDACTKQLAFSVDDENDYEHIENIFRALASAPRLALLKEVASGPVRISELRKRLNISNSNLLFHVDILKKAGLVIVEYEPSKKGFAQIVFPMHATKITFELRGIDQLQNHPKAFSVNMPVGHYVDIKSNDIVRYLKPDLFIAKSSEIFMPYHTQAVLVWFSRSGYVIYDFPVNKAEEDEIFMLEFTMEICSEAPFYKNDWKSNIDFYVNDVKIGSYLSYGDYGDRRGKLNADAFPYNATQYGMLVNIKIDETGTYFNGVLSGERNIFDIIKTLSPYGKIRLAVVVPEDADYVGGINIFGKSCGDYPVDIVMTYYIR